MSIRTRPLLLLALVPLLVVFNQGCGPVRGYAGPVRPPAEVVNIQPNPFWSDLGVTIRRVDDLAVTAELSLDVLPGERTLEMQLIPTSRVRRNQLSGPFAQSNAIFNLEWRTSTTWSVDLQAGDAYAIAGRWFDGTYTVELQRLPERTVVATKTVEGVRRPL